SGRASRRRGDPRAGQRGPHGSRHRLRARAARGVRVSDTVERAVGAAASDVRAKPMPSLLKLAGPGLVVAAAGIGSGDVVAASVAGANYGVVLLWALLLGAFFKFVLTEGIARWQLATGMTALEG